MTIDFNTYIENLSYFEHRQDTTDWTFRQRERSTRYKLTKTLLSEKLGTGELCSTLLEIANSAILLFGKGVTGYKKYNVGTKKNPLEYVIFTITLNDLIKYKKGVENMSDSLKNEIIGKSFVSCTIECDINGTLS